MVPTTARGWLWYDIIMHAERARAALSEIKVLLLRVCVLGAWPLVNIHMWREARLDASNISWMAHSLVNYHQRMSRGVHSREIRSRKVGRTKWNRTRAPKYVHVRRALSVCYLHFSRCNCQVKRFRSRGVKVQGFMCGARILRACRIPRHMLHDCKMLGKWRSAEMTSWSL